MEGLKAVTESIRENVYRCEANSRKLTGQKREKAKQEYNKWLALLQTAEEIYHSGDPDAENRIKGLKLYTQSFQEVKNG
jgi:hypothetical protein